MGVGTHMHLYTFIYEPHMDTGEMGVLSFRFRKDAVIFLKYTKEELFFQIERYLNGFSRVRRLFPVTVC